MTGRTTSIAYFITMTLPALLVGYIIHLISKLPIPDAIFTGLSAITLTGPDQVIPATHPYLFSLLILLLIQTGIIGALFFPAVLARLLGKSLSIPGLEGPTSATLPRAEVLKILRTVVFFALIGELLVFIAIFFLWTSGFNLSPADGPHKHWLPEGDIGPMQSHLFHSLFLAISAFGGAGFTGIPAGMANTGLEKAYILRLALTGILFVSNLGFPAIFDMLLIKNLRARMLNPLLDWKLNTRVAFYSSSLLLLIGAVLFWTLESNHALADQKIVEKGINALFQSSAATGSGFISDASLYTQPTRFLFMFLMLLGGAALSLGGGLRSHITGFLFGRHSPDNILQLRKPFFFLLSCILAFIALCWILMLVLNCYNPHCYFLYRVVAAFTNNGFYPSSTGEVNLTHAILALCMLGGRVGLPITCYYAYWRLSGN